MEAIIATPSRTRLFTFSGICALIAILSGCSTAHKPTWQREQVPADQATQTTPTSILPETMGPQETYGPPLPAAEPVYGPEPIQIRPLVLVFSPGVVRGFAHSGVLEALNKSKVPVGAVLGSEVGALIAAIYGRDGNINHLEWELMKFKEDTFLSEKGLLPTHKLTAELSHYFGQRDLHGSKIPVTVAIELKNTGAVELVSRGPAKQALRAALAIPGLLSPGEWKGSPAISGRKSLGSLVREARLLGIGPVVVIDVGPRPGAGPEIEGADLVLRPDLSGIGDLDFNKRTEAVFRGKKAIADHRNEIYHWAGIPEGDR